MEILNHIPVKFNMAQISKALHIRRDQDLDLAKALADSALDLIDAKAMYKICYIEKKLEDGILVEGLTFKSRVLRKNLDQVERIFPYVITIGPRFEEEMRKSTDILKKYYLDILGTLALTSARNHFQNHLKSKYALEKMSFMSPGSLADWPIQEQRPLFELLGDAEKSVGVTLTSSLLMLPAKSVSGVYFPTEVNFFSCQLCPRKDCMGRKAAFDKEKAQEYGINIEHELIN
jgi:hypothetical protein